MRLRMWIVFPLALALSGCGVMTMIQSPERLTPEQIAAYEKTGKDVYSCFTIAGPPPVGGTTTIIAPKGSKPHISFGANCQLMRAEATQTPAQ